MGQIGILNVGAGDTKLIFDASKPEDCARAARTIADMIRRGYAILVEAGKDEKGEILYRRVREFREDTCEYIIAGDPPEFEKGEDHEQSSGAAASTEGSPETSRRKANRTRTRAIHASATSGVAVGRVAGG